MKILKSAQISQKDAQPILAKFLERTKTKPHLHPDAWLATEGVRWGPKGGPNGGWAIHHLQRIEAGMRGVNLMPESKEELVAKFGDEAIQHGIKTSDSNQPGTDNALDESIQQTELQYVEEEPLDLSGKSGKDLTAAEKKARKDAKKKRSLQEQADGESTRKRKKDEAEDLDCVRTEAMDLDNDPDAQSKESYEREQEILEGEVGEREGAPSSKQNIPEPALVTHDADGQVDVPKKARTAEEKAARKAAKKARKHEEGNTANAKASLSSSKVVGQAKSKD